ncbi:hypothetical protein [Prosthecobacter sp.]|uniref:hypothetical protein n=1 Tax=Prosthecobacter sp. TaxID=1965333 RepID=UPI0025ED0DE6|nr:hypothetical protein [Prosthecobacter sp.]
MTRWPLVVRSGSFLSFRCRLQWSQAPGGAHSRSSPSHFADRAANSVHKIATMPEKLRFDPQDTLSSQDFSFRENTEMSAAQANETFMVDARFNRSLGKNGEALGFAKKQFSDDPQVAQARQNEADRLQDIYMDLEQEPKVKQWIKDRHILENIDAQITGHEKMLQEAKEQLEAAQNASPPDEAAIDAHSDAVDSLTKQLNKLKHISANPEEEKQRLLDVRNNTPSIQEYQKVKRQFNAAINLTNSIDSVAESSAELFQDNKSMRSAKQGGDRRLLARAVASHEVDKLLELNVCAEEKFAVDEKGVLYGVSVQCDGAGVRSEHGENDYGEPNIAFLDTDYSAPQVQHGVHDLEVLDYITGQIDRHAGNIFIAPSSGKVTGIDNDLAFPEIDRDEMLQRSPEMQAKVVPGMPKMIHKDTAAKILATDPEELRRQLQAVRPPNGDQGLSDEEIDGAVKRLTDLQTAIRLAQEGVGDMVIVAEFNQQTYQAAIQNQEKAGIESDAPSTSYIGAIEKERQATLHLMQDKKNAYQMRSDESVSQAKLNPEYAAYQAMDPAQQEQYRAKQAEVDELEVKLAEVRQEMARMEAPEGKSHSARKQADETRRQLLQSEAAIVRELNSGRDQLHQMTGTGQEAQQRQPQPQPGEEAPGNDANPPQVENQPIQPDSDMLPNGPKAPPAPIGWKSPNLMSPDELEQYRQEAKAIADKPTGDMNPAELAERKRAIMAKLPPFEDKLSDLMEIPEFVELDAEGIDQFILENLPGQAIMKDVAEGDEFAPRQYAMDMFPPGSDHQAKRAAVEARLTQILVLKPLQKEIERVKAELAELEQTPGIEAGDERIEAKKEQLGELYQDLSQCELRLEANKEAMNRAARKYRVAPAKAEAKAEAEALKEKEKAPARVTTNDKPEQLQQENLELYRKPKLIDASVLVMEGMQLDQPGYRPLHSSPHAIAEAYRSEFKSRLTRKRNNQPENLPEEVQGELQDELAQDAKLNALVQETAALMQPVIDQLNVLQMQRAELNNKLDQKREDLVKQLAENPSLIEDAAVRAKAEGAKAELLQAEEIIQQCDNQLAGLENPDEQTTAAAIQQHGSVEAAKEHYKKEKKEAVQKKGAAEGQLYPAINAAVGPLVEKDPETLSIKAQIAELKGQQEALIQQYKEEKTAEAQAIREKRPDQRVAVGTEVKDAMEPGNQMAPDSDRKGGIKPSARSEANPGTPLKLQEEELRRNIDQVPYQQYQANVAMAAREFKMRPEIIPDPANREKGIALKQQIAKLEAEQARYEKELGKLQQGKVGARLRSMASGATKESYAQKQAAVKEQLEQLEKELDDLAQDAVSVSIKQDLLNAVKPPTQVKVSQQGAAQSHEAVSVNQPGQPGQELADNVPNSPAPPPPDQEMSKKPKTKISAKAKDAGDGMPVAPPLVENPPLQPNQDLLAKAPKYPAPPPPEDEASLAPKTSMTDEQIDKAINDHFPHNQVAADLQEGNRPNYRDIAGKISGAVKPSNMADRQAIEVRLIEKREIEPLRAEIERLEGELEALEKSPGIEPGDERVEAKKAQLNELYEDLDNWEVRVETLKRGMAVDDRKNRLAALNEELDAEKQALEGVEKVDKVHFAEDLDEPAAERHQARLQAASGFAAASLAKSEIKREFTAQDIKAAIKKGFGDKYDVAYGGPGEDLDGLVDEWKPVIDKVNLLQKEIRQLDEAHDQMLIQKCGDFEQDPSRIENGEQRERVEKAKLGYQQADERIQHCDKRIAALKNPGPLERAKAVMQHGSLEKAREHYQNEKREATKQRNDSKRNLDDGLMNAARDVVNQGAEAKALVGQMENLKQEQKAVLQEFGQQKMAGAEELLSQLIDHANSLNQSQPMVDGKDLKSGLKASASVETNKDTLSRAADRAQRDHRLKPTVQEQLNHGAGEQPAKHDAAPGSLRANWKSPVKQVPAKKVNAPVIGKH